MIVRAVIARFDDQCRQCGAVTRKGDRVGFDAGRHVYCPECLAQYMRDMRADDFDLAIS